MKKTCLIWLFIVIVSSLTNAQIPKEAFPLTNSLYSLWHEGKTEQAIETTIKLYELYPPFMIDNVHNLLAQNFRNKLTILNSAVFLEELRKRKNEAINSLIEPLYLWSKTIDNSDPNQLKNILSDLSHVLSDSSNYKSYAERYCLLTLNEPAVQKLIDQKTKEQLLLKVIRNLETYPHLIYPDKGGKGLSERAWNRYLLAYSYYSLFSKFDQKEEYLMKASNYSPDEVDIQVKDAYYYEASFLTGNTKQIGYKIDYLNYLKTNHKVQESLSLLAEIAFNTPSDDNLKALKDYYAILSLEKPFKEYWLQFINQKCKNAPQLKIKFTEGALDLMQKPGHWVYIDVWGTWCSPCVKELPILQEFFTKNRQDTNSILKIYTFSYSSQNLSLFMTENQYTFPVSEIDKQVNDAFEVTSYPTKILITPQGKYLKIPFNVDWKMYIRNYCLM
ncbi:MAG: TlpA disulfide reductase family protein [Bacteroidia bacterium]|nr:TlpA disulfide reductase family protein [Bacteroidia bacterium]